MMCELDENEKPLDMPVVLGGKALSYYASGIRNKPKRYEEAVQTLKDWCTFEKQRT